MKKIRKGDAVIVIAGKDKGKQSVVLAVLDDKLLLENVNMVKKNVRANPQKNERGGIIDKPMPIHCSNVMLYDSHQKKASRVSVRINSDGQRIRYFKTSGEPVAVAVKGN